MKYVDDSLVSNPCYGQLQKADRWVYDTLVAGDYSSANTSDFPSNTFSEVVYFTIYFNLAIVSASSPLAYVNLGGAQSGYISVTNASLTVTPTATATITSALVNRWIHRDLRLDRNERHLWDYSNHLHARHAHRRRQQPHPSQTLTPHVHDAPTVPPACKRSDSGHIAFEIIASGSTSATTLGKNGLESPT